MKGLDFDRQRADMDHLTMQLIDAKMSHCLKWIDSKWKQRMNDCVERMCANI
jgi:hypothetical protein